MTIGNRLAELMAARGMKGAELARRAGTSRQQIDKLSKGALRISREWAERLAPHLGVDWPVLLGWEEDRRPRPEGSPTQSAILAAVGSRIAWGRNYRRLSLEDAASRFAMTTARLEAIEAGEVEPSILELITISLKLRLASDFILLGLVADGMSDTASLLEEQAQKASRRP